ncbi:MAG: carotenoid biosynthesis protein [Alphaproteobacteria bacterium]|uniref:Carotenoid biosynthesis protein n=1 Tax=Candidatus Nitrobium versatile TaxID=2884831 RepID=A0A953M334_9BACT|nr:carotenoid biosynthesis protein [Candidatus Nitrobium versatile]
MESLLSQSAGTLLLRPYVFLFLLVYLVGCSLHLGMKRALLFCAVGYFIAWTSEYSSIHNGIPYGDYYYLDATRGREIWVLGVPFMDSLSYVFLAYASYCMALAALSPVMLAGRTVYLLETRRIRCSSSARILGALFFVYLDVIIDPVALRGDRWFLGQIYGYPGGGVYFGVPLSNFIGWFVVGFLMLYALQTIDKVLYRRGIRDYAGYRYPWRYLAGPALYAGVVLFNIFITFLIGEHTLGWVDVFIVLFPGTLLYFMIKIKLSLADIPAALRKHLDDFPEATLSRILYERA